MTIAVSDHTSVQHDRADADRHRSLRAMLLRHPGWSAAGIVLIGFNLRPGLTSIAPFITDIRHDAGLSGAGIGLLTMLPVLCLGIFAPLAPPLARRFGTEAVVLASLLGLAAGILLRSFGTVPLFAGTLVIGASMSLLGVLSPVVVKRDFPRHVGLMMGLYMMLISLGATLSTAGGVPLRHALGGSWEAALLFWAVPALIAALVFIPQLFRSERGARMDAPRVHGLLRDPLAWEVTGFFALVTSLAYAVFTWAPIMLQARGLEVAASGLTVSISYIAQMLTGLTVPMLATRMRSQRALAIVLMLLTTTGLFGFIFAPVWSLTAFSIVLGLGQGGAFGLAMSLIVLRAGDRHAAGQLSGLAQTVGYIAGGVLGPFAVGIIHDISQSWPVVAIFYGALALLAVLLGLAAGRARTVAVEIHHR